LGQYSYLGGYAANTSADQDGRFNDRRGVFYFLSVERYKQPFGIINGGEVLEGLAIDLRTVFEDIG